MEFILEKYHTLVVRFISNFECDKMSIHQLAPSLFTFPTQFIHIWHVSIFHSINRQCAVQAYCEWPECGVTIILCIWAMNI